MTDKSKEEARKVQVHPNWVDKCELLLLAILAVYALLKIIKTI